jgi:hypothetical protein
MRRLWHQETGPAQAGIAVVGDCEIGFESAERYLDELIEGLGRGGYFGVPLFNVCGIERDEKIEKGPGAGVTALKMP